MSSSAASASPQTGSLRALLWDVDGTLAETELEGHRRAFNRAFAEEELPFRWDVPTYLRLLRISGGRERMRSFGRERGQPLSDGQIERLQQRKQWHYEQLVRSGMVQLRPGVARLILEAQAAGLTQAIVTTSGRASVQALLEAAGAGVREAFAFWICGEDVERKKPDPQGYCCALRQLGLDPASVLAIEDSGNGLQAATAAGLACLVTLSDSSRWEAGPDGSEGFEAALALLEGMEAADRPLRPLPGPMAPARQVSLAWLQQLSAAA